MGFLVVLFGVLNIWCALSDNSSGDPSQGILIVIFLICLFFWLREKSKESTSSSSKQNIGKNVTCTISNTVEKSYVDYLREFSNVVYTVAESAQSNIADLQVSVTISKKNNRYCKVNFSIFEDCITLPSNITFGGSIVKEDNDSIWFRAENATGFISPYDVQKDVIQQITMNTSKYQVVLTKNEVFTHGDFAVYPFVSCTFKVVYNK